MFLCVTFLRFFLFFSVYYSCLCYFFFFSSRRRHTRCLSDWSSDVCSSDLGLLPVGGRRQAVVGGDASAEERERSRKCTRRECRSDGGAEAGRIARGVGGRSEERRVGKSGGLGGRGIRDKRKEGEYRCKKRT